MASKALLCWILRIGIGLARHDILRDATRGLSTTVAETSDVLHGVGLTLRRRGPFSISIAPQSAPRWVEWRALIFGGLSSTQKKSPPGGREGIRS